jgi:hypothetical protein
MRIGFNLPNSGSLSVPATMARIAQEGEALGYDYLTLTDHVVLPDMKAPGYPYSESDEFYGADPAVEPGLDRCPNRVDPAGHRRAGGAAPTGCADGQRCWRRSTCCRVAGWWWALVRAGWNRSSMRLGPRPAPSAAR